MQPRTNLPKFLNFRGGLNWQFQGTPASSVDLPSEDVFSFIGFSILFSFPHLQKSELPSGLPFRYSHSLAFIRFSDRIGSAYHTLSSLENTELLLATSPLGKFSARPNREMIQIWIWKGSVSGFRVQRCIARSRWALLFPSRAPWSLASSSCLTY